MSTALSQKTGIVSPNPLRCTPIATPAVDASSGFFYGKTVGSRVEAHWLDSLGSEVQLTSGGSLAIPAGVIVDGGNAFGANISIGATDNYYVSIIANLGVEAARFNSTRLYFPDGNSNFASIASFSGPSTGVALRSAQVDIVCSGVTRYQFQTGGLTMGNLSFTSGGGITTTNASGTEATPIWRIQVSTDVLGIYRPTTATLGFVTGSVERMRVNTVGLGVGTKSPANKLHVYDTATAGYFEALASGSSLPGIKIANPTASGSSLTGIAFALKNDNNDVELAAEVRIGMPTITDGGEEGTYAIHVMRNGAMEKCFEISGKDETIDFLASGSSIATMNPSSFNIKVDLVMDTFLEGTEQGSAPDAPAADGWRMYAVDNGGKTEVLIRFNSGAAQQVAIEP